MILQALTELHARLSSDPQSGLPPLGYSLQDISLKVVLAQDGKLLYIEDFREEKIRIQKNGKETRSKKAKELLVPGQARASEASFAPCFLWDDTRFVFGWHGVKNDPVRNQKCFDAFCELHLRHEDELKDADFSAVCTFLSNWKVEQVSSHPELLKVKKGRVVFQISGKTQFVHENPSVKVWVSKMQSNDISNTVTHGQCLVSGKSNEPISRLHPGIKNIQGAPYTGASLVSFNNSAYESYGKEGKSYGRGANSPTSAKSALSYTSALDWLLSKQHRNFRIADSTIVFWTDEATNAEENLPWMLASPPATEDDETKKRIADILKKIVSGTLAKDQLGNPKAQFYILGLSLNQGRLSIRLWQKGNLGDLIEKLKDHFSNLAIVRQWDETNSLHPDPIAPSAKRLLLETAPLKDGRRDESKVSPQLSGALMRAILTGTRYPDSLVNSVMNRIRVIEKKQKGEGSLDNVTYLRVAILKAWLIRNHNSWLNYKKIIMTQALDKDNPHAAYQLGRLFATYEQVQRAAHKFKLDRTIRETMFSAASATPQSIFGRLDRLNKHHLPKLTAGSKRHFDNLLDEIHQKIRGPQFYPASLNLKEQSLFCIGYYHQRHEFRLKHSN